MIRIHNLRIAGLCCALALAGACGNDNDDDEMDSADYEADATLAVKDYINGELNKLAKSAEALQAAAPEPDDDGWNDKDDKAAVDDMRDAWADARDEYESIEGAIAILFESLDVSTDERYDGFIESEADDDLFDGEGVTGVHGIERILWADSHPANVVAFESKLDGYQKAAFPADEDQADEFKNGLAERLVTDTKKMRDDFKGIALDADTAFNGVIGSMQEQVEKVTLGSSAEDESRYAQRTLDDMRANLEGGRKVYDAFRTWVKAEAGEDLDADIVAGFDRIADAYAEVDGSGIPEVPDGFDPEDPSDDDLKTEYGKLWSLLMKESDPDAKGSLVSDLIEAADALGITVE
jgi:iron uptake system component EfeO